MLRLLWLLPSALAAAPPASPPPTPPTVAAGSVLRPTFTLTDGKTFTAGVAFAAEYNSETLVLTAYQLFGPPGGLPAAIPADQMATQVKSGRMMDAFSKQSVGTDLVTVNVPGAHAMSSDAAGDLALFRAPVSLDRLGSGNSIPFHGLPLAAADPKNGDIVWMAGPVEGDTAPLHAAHIVEVKPGFLFYAFDGTVNLLATSGSPLLNSKGEVVGIHLGGGVSDGQTIGAAGPVSTVRKNLAAALTP
jgi:hypothetical protein